MSWDVASIYPHNFPTSWCHLICEVHLSLLQQSTPTTWCCHPSCFTVGMVFFVIQASFLQKVQSLAPCAVANRTLTFLWLFWSGDFFLAERPFRICWSRTRFTVDIYTFVPVSSSIFTRSIAVVLGMICTFHIKVRSSLGCRMRLLPEWYDGYVVPRCLYLPTIVFSRWTWYLQAFVNCSQGWTRLVEVHHFFSEVLADFFWFSYDVKQRVTEFEGRSWNTSTGTPSIDSNYVN